MEFKVGDRVYYLEDKEDTATVIGETTLGNVRVTFDDGGTSTFYPEDLTLVDHVDVDLTKIDKPFGELDKFTKMALIEAWIDGEVIQAGDEYGYWHYVSPPIWSGDVKYRVKPKPVVTAHEEYSEHFMIKYNRIDGAIDYSSAEVVERYKSE